MTHRFRHEFGNDLSVYIYDASGVAATLCRYMPQYHPPPKVQMQVYYPTDRGYWGLYDYYGVVRRGRNKYGLIWSWLRAGRNADILHVHNTPTALRWMRKFYPKKRIIYHDHSIMLTAEQTNIHLADRVLLAIPPLEGILDGTYVPNPVDVEHFHPRPVQQNNRGRIICKRGMRRSTAQEWLDTHGYGDISWDWVYDADPHVPFVDLPDHLASYEYVADLDMRFGAYAPYHVHNLIGLQAMSVGCKTICWDGLHDKMPEQHHPKAACDTIYQIYQDLLPA